jgi:hypothetical protein
MKEWAKTIPNDGILRYYIVGNMERLTITSPAVLSEILVSKAYDFAKPLVIQQTLRRVLGNGILIAEGEEHKVRNSNVHSTVHSISRFVSYNHSCSFNVRISSQLLRTAMSRISILSSGPRARRWPS